MTIDDFNAGLELFAEKLMTFVEPGVKAEDSSHNG